MKHPRPERLVFQGGAKPGEHAQVKFMLIGAGDDHDDEMDRQGIHARIVRDAAADQGGGGSEIGGGRKPDMRNRNSESDPGALKVFPRADGIGQPGFSAGSRKWSEQIDQHIEGFLFTGLFKHGTSIRRKAAG